MKTRDRTLRNTLFSSLGIYTEYFLGMLAAIMIARHLGPAEYGVYGLFMWLVSVGVVITNSGVTTGVIKFVAELRGGGNDALIVPAIQSLRRAQHLHLLVALGIGMGAYLLLGHHLPLPMGWVEFLMLLGSMVMRASYMFNVAVAKGFEAFDATAKIALVAAPLNLALVILAMLLKGSIFWFVVVYAASSVAFLGVSSRQAWRLTTGLPRVATLPLDLRQRMRRHLRLVSATVVIGFFIASDVEILFLTMYDSARSAGYFKVAYQLATGVALLVPGVFGALLLPMMAKALSEGRAVAGRRFIAVTSYLTLLATPVVAFGTCFASAVIALLYGPSYASAAPVFAFIIFSCSVSTATQGASSLLVSADRQHTILLLTLVFGALKVTLDMLLIAHFGLSGAVSAIVTISLASSVTYLVIGMRVGGVRLEWGRLLRVVLSGTAATLLVLPIRELHLQPIWTILLGGTLLTLGYSMFTLLLGCWSQGDLDQLRGLHLRFTGGRPRMLGQLLAWAGTRAGRRE